MTSRPHQSRWGEEAKPSGPDPVDAAIDRRLGVVRENGALRLEPDRVAKHASLPVEAGWSDRLLGYHPEPSPDGQWLVYGSKRGGVRQLFVRRLEDRVERQLTDLKPRHAAM